MRDYPTAEGFRAAVEAKLRDRARQLGVATYAVRRQAALERLLVRLTTTAPNRWALKGGLALDTRLGARARVSLDLDAEHAAGIDAARMDLQRAAAEEMGDHFAFALTGQTSITDGDVALAVRFALESTLAGRRFEPLQVDVTVATPDPWDAQPATRPGLLSCWAWHRSTSCSSRSSAGSLRSCMPTLAATEAVERRAGAIWWTCC